MAAAPAGCAVALAGAVVLANPAAPAAVQPEAVQAARTRLGRPLQ